MSSSPTFPSLHLRYNSFSNHSVALPTSQLILQPFRCFSYVTVHSLTLLSLLQHHKFFTQFTWRAAHDQLILQPLRHFTYVTTHSPTLPSLYPRHSSFSNPSVASPTSQFILQPFFRFSYVTSTSLTSPCEPPMSSAYSPTFPSLHLRHNSFSNPSVALPTSQLILQSFRCFTYVTVHSSTLLSLLLRHKLFT